MKKNVRCWRCDAGDGPQDGWGQIYLRDNRTSATNNLDWPEVDLCQSCTAAFKRDFIGGWKCPEVLMLEGEAYRCDSTCVDADGVPVIGHDGWAHGSKEAQAIWGKQ